MTYLIPIHLVAGSDPSKPGQTGLVAAFPSSRSCQNRSDFTPIRGAHMFHFQCVLAFIS